MLPDWGKPVNLASRGRNEKKEQYHPEDKTTEELSDVLMDRFDFIYMDYPEALELEVDIVKTNGETLATFDESKGIYG